MGVPSAPSARFPSGSSSGVDSTHSTHVSVTPVPVSSITAVLSQSTPTPKPSAQLFPLLGDSEGRMQNGLA